MNGQRSMRVVLLAGVLWAGCGQREVTVTLAWNPNPEPDVVGYVIYYGTQSRSYTASTNVGKVTRATVRGPSPGTTWHFAITAINAAGLESDFSAEVSHRPGSGKGSARSPGSAVQTNGAAASEGTGGTEPGGVAGKWDKVKRLMGDPGRWGDFARSKVWLIPVGCGLGCMLLGILRGAGWPRWRRLWGWAIWGRFWLRPRFLVVLGAVLIVAGFGWRAQRKAAEAAGWKGGALAGAPLAKRAGAGHR